MGLAEIRDLLDLAKCYPGVRVIDVPGLVRIEIDPPPIPITAVEVPMVDLMPPDDVMMFAATEDPEEAIKQRKE